MPKRVKILLSTYNGDQYLKEQIESILGQEDVITDILARDDGSNDFSISILNSYGIKFFQGKNMGAKDSFLELIMKTDATNEFYAFCDQDDIWDKNKLKVAVEYLDDYKNTPALYFCERKVLIENEIVEYTKMNELLDYHCLLFKSVAAGCTIVINREMLLLLRKYYPKHIAMHDSWMIIICSLFGKIIYDEIPHINYRIHENNAVGIISKKKLWIKRIRNMIKLESYRSYTAYDILQGYSEYLENQKDKLDFLVNISQVRGSMHARIPLIFSRYRYSKHKLDDLAIRIQIFLGRI